MAVVAAVGIFTALLAATIALAQTDIKRVLAYSTVSQLGYMFAAAGVGAFSAGIFHLVTHAFFKALLFLGAGSVIHALGGEQDMMRMGGLRRFTPVTYRTMLIAALAISGIFPLSGFFSKDEILWSAWSQGHQMIWAAGLVTSGLTAFYMFRLVFLTFWGEGRMDEHTREHLHESPLSMTAPLTVLAVLSFAGGWIGLPAWMGRNNFSAFLEPSLNLAHRAGHEAASHSVELLFAVVAVTVAAFGISLAFRLYVSRPELADIIALRFAGMHSLLRRKYYLDEIYDALFVNPTVTTSTEVLWKGLDVRVIDGSVNGVGRVIHTWAGVLKHLQDGLVRSYASWILAGAVAVLVYLYAVARG